MFKSTKNARHLASRKADALSMFYSAKEKLSRLMADQTSYLFELEDEISYLKNESELIEGEINRIANNYITYSGWFK